ncbi:histone acetyltransferase GCN5-like [Durio zibethinus]|uniref:Histone acetyltransferase GCN5-like n=1 Tax=Durio zibethinus TaxID=66656 RepID=A0A6P6AH83_DURZI|nr:histone acetyltransferase GCN5-like [Durio zibethinus]
MLSGEYRRSPRIVELDARKAQESRSQNMANVICEVMDVEELDKGQDILKQKRGRKKVKVRAVQDLVVNSVEYKDQKTDTGNDEDHLINAANVPSRAATPEKSKLELLLGILQRFVFISWTNQALIALTKKYNGLNILFPSTRKKKKDFCVEFYYDVIKEPMDFGTIAKKLNEGSYQTLEEFEHDVFLISNNAMLFNASNTIYYRQARALKELATRLFLALKTDPENFETEASMRRMGVGRRSKADIRILNCNSNNKNNTGIGARGHRAQRGLDDFEVEKRQTYRAWNSFLSENGSLVSAIYNSPKQLKLVSIVSSN